MYTCDPLRRIQYSLKILQRTNSSSSKMFRACCLLSATCLGELPNPLFIEPQSRMLETKELSSMLWPMQSTGGARFLPLPRKLVLLAARAESSHEDASSLRHVIITGGNCGIGKATATELAKRGMSITLACRNKDKGDLTCSEISELSGNPCVRAMSCDLASLKSVCRFVEGYKKQNLPLHVLVNNAGVMACPLLYTEDGFEWQFGVNHLGHFFLTALLLEVLIRSSSSALCSRIVIVASAAERIGDIDFKDLNFKGSRDYNRWIAYGQSKLANCLFSYELNRRCRLAGLKVTANCLHPGIVDTQLSRYFFPRMMVEQSFLKGLRPFILKFLGIKTPEEGASTVVHLASSKSLEGVSGFYFEDCQRREPSSQAMDNKLATKLWEVSEKLTMTSDVFSGLGPDKTTVGVGI